jgi:hypothetical protein
VVGVCQHVGESVGVSGGVGVGVHLGGSCVSACRLVGRSVCLRVLVVSFRRIFDVVQFRSYFLIPPHEEFPADMPLEKAWEQALDERDPPS